jgi:hypothetical protein
LFTRNLFVNFKNTTRIMKTPVRTLVMAALAALPLLFSPHSAKAQDSCTWPTGSVGDWFNSSKWNNGIVPSVSTTNVSIIGTVSVGHSGSPNGNITTVQIGPDNLASGTGVLRIGSGGSMILYADAILTCGQLFIGSTGDTYINYNSVVNVLGDASVSGTLYVYNDAHVTIGSSLTVGSNASLYLQVTGLGNAPTSVITTDTLSLAGELRLTDTLTSLVMGDVVNLISAQTSLGGVFSSVRVGSSGSITITPDQMSATEYTFDYKDKTYLLDYAAGVSGADVTLSVIDPATYPFNVPEPGTWAMLLGGLGVLALCVRRRRAVPALRMP